MARNAPDPSERRTSSRVTKSPVQRSASSSRPQPRSRRDRRKFWTQVIAAFLVLAMLLPVLIAFL